MAQKAGWRVEFEDQLSDTYWLSFYRENTKLVCHCVRSMVWISEEIFSQGDYPDGFGEITHSSEMRIMLSNPESTIKIQKYLRDRC